jgi:hypothetical protein
MKTTSKRKSKIIKNKTLKQTNKKQTDKIKSCNDFCKNVYVSEIDKQNKEIAKKTNFSYKPTKKDRDLRISNCKKNFCNKNCKQNYKYYDKESETLFVKNMKNNFITNMRPRVINTMREKGAISYCDGFVYNPFNRNE